MKTKKFTFKQTVFSKVKTEFTYKIEAKSYEEAEEKFKKAFLKKMNKGKQYNPLKKLDPKKEVLYETPLLPEEVGNSTLKMEFISNKKDSRLVHELFNNLENQWKSFPDARQLEAIEETEDHIASTE